MGPQRQRRALEGAGSRLVQARRQPHRRVRAWLARLFRPRADVIPLLTIVPPKQRDSFVPPNWSVAVGDALETMARRYHLPIVQRDFQGANKRFPAFKDEFWREVVKRL